MPHDLLSLMTITYEEFIPQEHKPHKTDILPVWITVLFPDVSQVPTCNGQIE